jgi:hypothetical protein
MSEQEYPSLIRKHWPKYLPETLAGSPPTPSSGGAARCATSKTISCAGPRNEDLPGDPAQPDGPNGG